MIKVKYLQAFAVGLADIFTIVFVISYPLAGLS
jgi:hypothetical protein